MILREIIRGIKIKKFDGYDGLEISGISIDSNKVKRDTCSPLSRERRRTDTGTSSLRSETAQKHLLVEDAPERYIPGFP